MNGSVWTTLAAAIVGGCLTILGQTILEMVRDGRRAEQLSHAIAGEISVVIEIIEARGYRAAIAAHLQAAMAGNPQILRVYLQQKYFAVIQANLQFIGVLPAELPILVPRFLNIANSAIEDVNALAAGNFNSLSAPDLAILYAGLDQMIGEVIKTGRNIVALVATIYGSPHNRYPCRVKFGMFWRRMVGWFRHDQ